MKLIGISGPNGSGKDFVGELLASQHHFLFMSLTDQLREEAVRRGVAPDRQATRTISAEWRRADGLAVLIDRAVAAFEPDAANYTGLILASLRHPAEADRVHELGGTVLWMDADPRVRYDRIVHANRGRTEDNKTFEQFLIDDQAEMHPTGDVATLNMAGVRDRADVTIMNETSTEELLAALNKAMHLA
jgi:cytidylate kinase